MRFPWLESRREGLAMKIALSPLSPLSGLYAAAATGHRALYEKDLLSRRRLPCRVVSVGNLTIGGSGKTPSAAWIAGQLLGRGHKTALLSRGYGGTSREKVMVVSDGRFVHAGPQVAGDEPVLLASHSVGVPVIVSPDRGVAGLRAVGAYGAEVVVLDDGLQHHRLARDVEIVTFDARFGFGNGRILPRGPLRERPSVLRRADAIGEIDGALNREDNEWIKRYAGDAFRFRAHRVPRRLRRIDGAVRVVPEVLAGMKVGLIAGLARTSGFRRTLEALGAEVIAERRFRDHHRYRPGDLRGLRDQAQVWITTEKDAVKILPSWAREIDLRVLEICFEVEEPRELMDWLEARLSLGPRFETEDP